MRTYHKMVRAEPELTDAITRPYHKPCTPYPSGNASQYAMGIPKPQLHVTLTHMGVRVSPRPVSADAKITTQHRQ